jgi:hypothetical protein
MSGISASFFGRICPTFCRKNRKSRLFCQKSAQVFVKNAVPPQEMKVCLTRIASGSAEEGCLIPETPCLNQSPALSLACGEFKKVGF